MKNTLVIILILILLAKISAAQDFKSRIVTSDIGNFWITYDRILQTPDSLERIRLVNELYLNPGSAGLHALVAARDYKDFEYVNAILNYQKYWNSIRNNSENLLRDVVEIEYYFTKLKEVYPELKPATIYFSIGAFRSAGTYEEDKVLLGAEFLLAHQHSIIEELPERIQNGMKDYMPFDIPLTALHELIHTQQSRWEHQTIVHRCVAEGVAEFLSTLIAEKPVSPPVKFGKENEKRVLDRYMIEILRDDDVWNWLSSKNRNELEVNDLGYYIGYEICERYYNNAADKQQAIKNLIELDYNSEVAFAELLDGTKFLPLSWNEIGVRYESMRPTVSKILDFKNGSKKVSPGIKTITVEFSEPMSECCRSTDYDESKSGEHLIIRSIKGWSDDYKRLTFEVADLKPNANYHLIISNFAKADGGNRLAPYTIEFRTGKK